MQISRLELTMVNILQYIVNTKLDEFMLKFVQKTYNILFFNEWCRSDNLMPKNTDFG